MKKFSAIQVFDAPLEQVVQAFRSETTWQSFAGLPFVGDPTLESFVDGDTTEIAMAYRVSIDLPPLADKFIDANKLTFVEHTRLHEDGTGTFDIVPDHYKKLLKSSGSITTVGLDTGRTQRTIAGIVGVSLGWSGKLFESPVEDAIVNGLTNALTAQAQQLRVT